ncbi:MAG: hypothetical protein ACT4PM_11275 [Gemmatimonadales bacterium]
MPTNRDFKRLVRRRMHKTGEAYTTARANLLKRPRPLRAAPNPPSASIAERRVPSAEPRSPAERRVPSAEPRAASAIRPEEFARLAGMSDEAIKNKTGCTWTRWVAALDYARAYDWPHRKIAEYVHQKYKVGGWWSQTVTVGYERIKGLRAIGQRRDGSYEANKSKTFPVPVGELYRAFDDARVRAKWLPGVEPTVRTASQNKSMRITWPDGGSVEVLFTGKGAGRSQVAIAHRKLPDQATSARMKEFWTERLEALGQALQRKGAA